jgi:hypothetical protein
MDTLEKTREWLRAFNARKAKFYEQHNVEILAYVAAWKRSQGAYVPVFHSSGSWATTYSNEFIAASAKLYMLFEKFDGTDPIDELADLFQKNNIRSCRGTTMYSDKVEYLYIHHLRRYVRAHH